MQRVTSLVVFLLLACVLCWKVAADIVAINDPEKALAIAPLHTEARVAVLERSLGAGVPDPSQHIGVALGGLASAPGDARLYSLLGAGYEASGDIGQASAYYNMALKLQKTERLALSKSYADYVQRGQFQAALELADVALRRWGVDRDGYFPSMVSMLSNAGAREGLLRLLATFPVWRPTFAQQLVQSAEGLALMRDLISAEARSNAPTSSDVVITLRALIRFGAYKDAYTLFLETRDEEQRARLGYVYDANFSGTPEDQPFSWEYQSVSNADFSFALQSSGGGLTIRFIDAPVQLDNLHQMIALPAGRFRLTALVDADMLSVPRRLYWNLGCMPSNTIVAELDVPAGSYQRQLIIEFDVPASDCAIQRLSIATDLKTDSWRDRYSGSVHFSALSIERH